MDEKLVPRFQSCALTLFSRREIPLVIFFLLFFFLIGLVAIYLPPIGGSSEAREAHVIQLMGEGGDYLLPLRNGIVPSKPPLYHWIGTLVSKIVGEYSPFTARIPSLLAGLCMALVTMVCAVRFSTDSERRINLLLWSVTIVTANYLFLKMTTLSMVDAVFAAMITLAIAPLVWTMAGDRPETRPSSTVFTFFYFFAGLAVLAKGPAAVLLSGSFLFFLLLARHTAFDTVRILLRPQIGWIVFFLVALPWYFFSAMRQADTFLGKQLIFENISRFLGGEHITIRPWWFYIPAFFRELAPWSILFVIGAWRAWRERNVASLASDFRHTVIRGLYAAAIFMIVFFSCAKGKRESYLLPLVPWLSVALAVQLEEFVRALPLSTREKVSRRGKYAWRGWLFFTVLAALLLEISHKMPVVFSNPIAATMQQWMIELLFPVSLVIVFAVALVPVTVKLCRERAMVAIARLVSVYSVCLILIAVGATIKNRFKNFEPVADRVNANVGEHSLQVVRALRDEFFDGVLYYLNRSVTLVDPNQFPAECQGYALLRLEHWREWQAQGALPHARLIEELYELDDHLLSRDQNQKVLIFCE